MQNYKPRSVPVEKVQNVRATLFVETNRHTEFGSVSRGEGEPLEEYAERVKQKVIEMHRRFEVPACR